jgi:ArsR family transcriptional regulator
MAQLLSAQKPTPSRTYMSQPNQAEAAQVASLPDNIAKDLVQLFKLLSDETRLRILYFLMQQEELNVRALCKLLGQSQPAVSHHLALLRVHGLIESRRDGKHNFYRILSHRFQELMEMFFSATGQQGGRIGFETFVLSYQPVAH